MPRARTSSVGRINVGDTSAGLSSMKPSRHQRRQSVERLASLSSPSWSDTAVFSKFFTAYRELTYRQTWIQPLIVLVFSVGLYLVANPDGRIHDFLRRCIVPSYHIAGTDQYGKGGDDFLFVFYYAIFFTFFREFCMCCILKPMAYAFGVTKEAKVNRFKEQGYAIIYYGITSPFGLYIMRQTPIWWFNTTAFYVDYPHKTHDILFKVYYLGQAAFWVQQSVVLILRLEKPRKDFRELVMHHIVTIALIWNSYRFHFTWIGLCVFISMDISDIFLAVSKSLNYMNSPLSGPFYLVFVYVWIYFRHYINLKILWSVLTEFKTVGPWELNWVTQQYKCYISQPIVFFLIGALQLVNIYWLFLILRIAWRYLRGEGAKDDRSDEEEDDSSEDEKKNQ